MGLVVAAAGIVVLLAAPPAYFERMNTISTEEGSAQGRIQAWGGAIRMAFAYPLTGVGAGNFPTAYGSRFRASSDIPQANAHSIFFQALGELGFPGPVVLISFFVWNLVANRRLSLQVRARDPVGGDRDLRLLASTSAAVVSFAVAGAFLSALYYPHLYVLAGLTTAARRVVRDQSQATAAPAAPRSKEIAVHWAFRPRTLPTPAPSSYPGRRLG
jgi:O-antigen ligase